MTLPNLISLNDNNFVNFLRISNKFDSWKKNKVSFSDVDQLENTVALKIFLSRKLVLVRLL